MKKKLLFTFMLSIMMLSSVLSQQRMITGTVTDASDGLQLPGVTVVVKDVVNVGTVTDGDGKYTIQIPPGAENLEFSFIGMESITVKIGTSNIINVAMETATKLLDEVVVTALGIQREEKALGFAAQKIGEDDLSASRATSVVNYLAGKVAGVQIARTGSGAGGSTNVVIRGKNSISGSNQPLYVVDGVPIINYSNESSSAGVASLSVDRGDGIGDINPQDVESMNVLKGPSATALYGSRGANGVILITTKSGKKGPKGIGVEVNSNVSFEDLYLIPKYQNKFGSGYDDEGYATTSGTVVIDGVTYPKPGFGAVDNWGGPLDGSILIPDRFEMPVNYSDNNVNNIPFTKVVPYVAQPDDNVRSFFNTGVSFTNNVALTSLSDKGSMRLSLGSVKTTGIVPNHEVSRKTVNFSGTTQVNKVLSFSGKVNYVRTDGNQRPGVGYTASNPMYTLTGLTRYTPLDFVKHQYETTKTNIRYPGINYNPYYIVNEVKNSDFQDRVIGLASATLQFNEWFNLMGRVGVDYFSQVVEERWPEDSQSRNSDSRLGQMFQSINRTRDLNADMLLTANRNVSNNINLNGILGTSIRQYRSELMHWDARDFKVKDVWTISNFNDIRPSSRLSEKEMQSVYFTGQLSFKNFLFLDVTGRNDWSSALGVNYQSFFYPSVSSSFVFTDAINLNKKILSFGKLRASWAQVGNDSGPYLTRAGYGLGTTGFNNLPYMSKNGTLPLWDLKNELTESVELGANLRFLNNRVSLDVTWYKASTTNQILSLAVSNASGYQNAVVNAGEIRNTGLEAMIGLIPIKTKNFSWDINFNYAANNSEVVTLDGTIETYQIMGKAGESGLSTIQAEVGAPYGNIVGYAYKRAPDGQKIVDKNGSYIKESKTSVLGNITPDWVGGLNNSISYKGFSLNVLLDFVQGGDIISATKYEMTRKGVGAWTVEGRRPKARYTEGDDIPAGSAVGDPMPYTGILEGVVDNGDGTYSKNTKAVPGQVYYGPWLGVGEPYIEDGSYISLREVIFSYQFKPSILKRTPFTGLTLTAVGRNLLYLQNGMGYLGLSPESAANTSGGGSGLEALGVPSTRNYGFNIKLTF